MWGGKVEGKPCFFLMVARGLRGRSWGGEDLGTPERVQSRSCLPTQVSAGNMAPSKDHLPHAGALVPSHGGCGVMAGPVPTLECGYEGGSS